MYLNKHPSQWPNLSVNWDHEKSNWHYAFDSDPPDWAKDMILGEALLSDIHPNLFFNSKVDCYKEFWKSCIEDKAEEVIKHWANGEALTPPALWICKEQGVNKILIAGGNHRFNVAFLSGEEKISFLTSVEHKTRLEALLPSLKWIP